MQRDRFEMIRKAEKKGKIFTWIAGGVIAAGIAYGGFVFCVYSGIFKSAGNIGTEGRQKYETIYERAEEIAASQDGQAGLSREERSGWYREMGVDESIIAPPISKLEAYVQTHSSQQ